MLPNGSIIECSNFVKNILEQLFAAQEFARINKQDADNAVMKIKQFVRLAQQPIETNDKPYIAIALPQEKIVRNFEDIMN